MTDMFALAGPCTIDRIRAEIDMVRRTTGEPPGKIVVTAIEAAQLRDDAITRYAFPRSVGNATTIDGVPIEIAS